MGVFLTWAAKPSVRESPNPAKNPFLTNRQHHLNAGQLLTIYEAAPLEVPSICGVR